MLRVMSNFMNKIDLIKKALNYSWKRNEIISNNIANADTPNYKAKDLDFKSFFDEQLNNNLKLNTTDTRHIQPTSESENIVINKDTITRLDQNTVDIEKEMSNLVKNSLYFEGLVAQLNREINKLKTVINEGGRK